MKSEYKRENLTITEFDTKDVITTSGETPAEEEPQFTRREKENVYRSFTDFNSPGSWF